MVEPCEDTSDWPLGPCLLVVLPSFILSRGPVHGLLVLSTVLPRLPSLPFSLEAVGRRQLMRKPSKPSTGPVFPSTHWLSFMSLSFDRVFPTFTFSFKHTVRRLHKRKCVVGKTSAGARRGLWFILLFAPADQWLVTASKHIFLKRSSGHWSAGAGIINQPLRSAPADPGRLCL